MAKRILITGGAGFIGSHLCTRLLNEGNHVICLDNLYTGTKSNIAKHLGNPFFDFVLHDITEPISIWVDQIYNLACPASPIHYQLDPIKTMRTSVLGAINVLELARSTGATVLQASTSEVYGDPHVHPQPETYWGNVNPIGVRSCYDEGKRAAETLFVDYHRHHGVNIKIARIFNTYGPNMRADDGRVVSNFIVQALLGNCMTVYGTGKQTRSFCYVDDLVDGLYRLMNSVDVIKGPINLGNPTEFTILDFAKTVAEKIVNSTGIEHKPLPKDDPTQRKPDIYHAKKFLDWEPKVNLDEGLEKTIDYFKAIL